MNDISNKNLVTLNLVRISALKNDALAQCVNTLMDNDSIVLLDDGCYNHNHSLLRDLPVQKPSVKIYMLGNHASARAINITQAHKGTNAHDIPNDTARVDIKLISMNELVELTFLYQRSITWQC